MRGALWVLVAHPSRPLRRIPPGSTWEITLRTLQSRLLMLPTPACRDRVLGILGRAVKRHPGIELHAFVFLSNHFHLLLTAKDGESLANFMCFLNSNLARKIGKLFGWRGRFWGRRYRAIQIIDEALQRLHYLLSQGVKEALVSSPHAWPGASCVRTLAFGDAAVGTWFNETAEFLARRRGDKVRPGDFATKVTVALVPLPCWREIPETERRKLVRDMIRSVEREAPPRVLGVEKILRQDPHDTPKTTSRSPSPPCHASTIERWKAFKDDYRAQRDRYVAISRRARKGDLGSLRLLPPDFFPPRIPARLLARIRIAAPTR